MLFFKICIHFSILCEVMYSFYNFIFFVKFSEQHECKEIRIIWENCNFGIDLIPQGKQWLMLEVYVCTYVQQDIHFIISLLVFFELLTSYHDYFKIFSPIKLLKHEKMNQNHCKKAKRTVCFILHQSLEQINNECHFIVVCIS